jgi:hypothetical protein
VNGIDWWTKAVRSSLIPGTFAAAGAAGPFPRRS